MSSVSSHSSDDDVRDVIGESGRARSAVVADESSSPPPDELKRLTLTSPEFGSDEGIVEKRDFAETTGERVDGYNTYECHLCIFFARLFTVLHFVSCHLYRVPDCAGSDHRCRRSFGRHQSSWQNSFTIWADLRHVPGLWELWRPSLFLRIARPRIPRRSKGTGWSTIVLLYNTISLLACISVHLTSSLKGKSSRHVFYGADVNCWSSFVLPP